MTLNILTKLRKNIILKIPRTIEVLLEGCTVCHSNAMTTSILSEDGTYEAHCLGCGKEYVGQYAVLIKPGENTTTKFIFSKPENKYGETESIHISVKQI